MDNNITVIIHGPLDVHFLKLNLLKLKNHLNIGNIDIIISSYSDSVDDISYLLKTTGIDSDHVNILGCSDVINPGFFNINRQINLVNIALNAVKDMSNFIVKIRMDQTINFEKFFKIVDDNQNSIIGKIISTNCYTRRDRLYHPSDMFLAANFKELRDYYPKVLFSESHLDNILLIKELVREGKENDFSSYWPESRLFIHYLKNIGIAVTHTHTDSFIQLKKHIYVINSWDIGLKWSKFLNGRCYVLPYTFNIAPFLGGPIENASNFAASEITGTDKILMEKVYISISKLYFSTNLYRLNSIFYDFKQSTISRLNRIFLFSLKLTPPLFRPIFIKMAKRIYYAIK